MASFIRPSQGKAIAQPSWLPLLQKNNITKGTAQRSTPLVLLRGMPTSTRSCVQCTLSLVKLLKVNTDGSGMRKKVRSVSAKNSEGVKPSLRMQLKVESKNIKKGNLGYIQFASLLFFFFCQEKTHSFHAMHPGNRRCTAHSQRAVSLGDSWTRLARKYFHTQNERDITKHAHQHYDEHTIQNQQNIFNLCTHS